MASVNLNGWDVVSLVTAAFANTAIQTQGTSPKNMRVSTNELEAQSSFGTWQITVGGSGNLLMFDIPLSNMAGKVIKNGQIVTQFSYLSLMARVQLALTFIDGTSTTSSPGQQGQQTQHLVIDSRNPPTSVISLADAEGKPLSNDNVLHDTFIREALTTWFGSNLSQFNHVFASVDLEPNSASDAQWAFCKPSVIAYTFIAGNSLANSYLGLTYNTGGNTTPGATAQIDPSFLPPGSETAFMLSPALFLANFLAPAAQHQFNLQPDWLDIDTSQMTATLKALDPKTVALQPIWSQNKMHTPYLLSLQLSVENSIITTYAKTNAVVLDKWYGKVTAFNESQSWMALHLDGPNRTLSWSNTQPSTNNHWTEKSEGFTIVQELLEGLGMLAIAVATILTDGAALLVVGALFGVAQGGMQWALAELESRTKDAAPEVDTLVSNITLPVKWASAGSFNVSQAGLYQGGFFLAGSVAATT